ncbi:hypothetical protein PI125_g16211 [Phytophthora idaei]|nr:hypothetical protein PI125_g16211 [Phytophthora idaei]KAG3142291.1 hypothetical protein PI126_g15104 [Phytophthora idaei]
MAATETASSKQLRYVEVSDDDNDDLLKYLDVKAMKEKNLETSPPLESFGPVDDRTAAQVFVPLWKACFQRKRHRDEMDADGDGSVHVSSIQTADGGLARRRMLARLRQRRYMERQKRRRLYGNADRDENDISSDVPTGLLLEVSNAIPPLIPLGVALRSWSGRVRWLGRGNTSVRHDDENGIPYMASMQRS